MSEGKIQEVIEWKRAEGGEHLELQCKHFRLDFVSHFIFYV